MPLYLITDPLLDQVLEIGNLR